MVILLLVSVLFSRTPTFFKLVGGEELKWRQLAHNQLMSLQGPHFSPYGTVKTNFKSRNQGSVLDYDNYYYEKLARNDGLCVVPEIDFHFETKARKVMVDFKFDAYAGKSS